MQPLDQGSRGGNRAGGVQLGGRNGMQLRRPERAAARILSRDAGMPRPRTRRAGATTRSRWRPSLRRTPSRPGHGEIPCPRSPASPPPQSSYRQNYRRRFTMLLIARTAGSTPLPSGARLKRSMSAGVSRVPMVYRDCSQASALGRRAAIHGVDAIEAVAANRREDPPVVGAERTRNLANRLSSGRGDHLGRRPQLGLQALVAHGPPRPMLESVRADRHAGLHELPNLRTAERPRLIEASQPRRRRCPGARTASSRAARTRRRKRSRRRT